jgi:uncharacterized membrane protein YtjA (UPF0391 family)
VEPLSVDRSKRHATRCRVGGVLQQSAAPTYDCDAARAQYLLLILGLQMGALGERAAMLHYAIVFFIIAIIAAVLGFGGIAASAAGIAKILFFVFLILAVVTFLRRA